MLGELPACLPACLPAWPPAAKDRVQLQESHLGPGAAEGCTWRRTCLAGTTRSCVAGRSCSGSMSGWWEYAAWRLGVRSLDNCQAEGQAGRHDCAAHAEALPATPPFATCDARSVGKGRDMGFDAINGFESKVAGGAGEQFFSRDVHRLATRVDFFRLLSMYNSGELPGGKGPGASGRRICQRSMHNYASPAPPCVGPAQAWDFSYRPR